MKKALGILLLLIPFIFITVVMVQDKGLMFALSVWGTFVLFFGIIVLGTWLINDR